VAGSDNVHTISLTAKATTANISGGSALFTVTLGGSYSSSTTWAVTSVSLGSAATWTTNPSGMFYGVAESANTYTVYYVGSGNMKATANNTYVFVVTTAGIGATQ
jgi:hypothetical protein